MFSGGPVWVPPPWPLASKASPAQPEASPPSSSSNKNKGYGGGTSSSLGKQQAFLPEEDKQQRKSSLTDEEFEHFQKMLRGLSAERKQIREAMSFSIANAEASEEISEIISDSLCIAETPISIKLARLFLVCDILHNSSSEVATNASSFRRLFEPNLPRIFDSLAAAYRSVGRITGELFKEKVWRVLAAWSASSVFDSELIKSLESRFTAPRNQ